jgi:two-component system, NarL family, response regulator NreC
MIRTRILLADDHTVIRAGIKLLLERQPEWRVVGEASDGREALNALEEVHPDVIVMDLAMPNLNGMEATRQILATHPDISVVVLSMHSDEAYVLRALKAGARGYVLKDSTETDLIAAVQAVRAAKSYFSPAVSRLLVEDYARQLHGRNLEDTYELLTNREREVLQLAAEGKSNKEIAGLLNLSVYTVETHRKNIMEKLNLHSVPELTLYAVRKGVIG